MSYSSDFIKDRSLAPKTEPDQQGKQRKLTIQPGGYQGSIEYLTFSYSFNKGEGIYFNAASQVVTSLKDLLTDVLKKNEKNSITIESTNTKGVATKLVVGRDDNLFPFIGLAGQINGQSRSKKFYFYPPKGIKIIRNGEPINDLEMQERMAKSFIGTLRFFEDALATAYSPQDFNGGGAGGRGYNNNNKQAPADRNYDNMFDD